MGERTKEGERRMEEDERRKMEEGRRKAKDGRRKAKEERNKKKEGRSRKKERKVKQEEGIRRRIIEGVSHEAPHLPMVGAGNRYVAELLALYVRVGKKTQEKWAKKSK